MKKRILVTGGAGFIGSHLVDKLIELGHRVRVFDNLEMQVHGGEQKIPEYLNKECEFIKGDIRDRGKLEKALDEIEIIFHEAAAVGVGQSMYKIYNYVETNTLGTANLLDILVNKKDNKVEKLIIASSMSVYGEGKYICSECGPIFPKLRSLEQLKKREWEMRCPICSQIVKPVPTDEDKPLYPTSIYAISKRDQEEMCLNVGRAYKIPTVALRYFNVYGQRQALSNPYTGVAAIFSSRIKNYHNPIIFEDGLQSRDFIYVSDIVQANILAMEKEEANFEVFNVGTGRKLTILDVANNLIKKLGRDELKSEIVNKYREGDIRYCYADISKIKEKLGYKSKVKFEEGIAEFINWAGKQKIVDYFEKSKKELEERGLTI